MKKNIIIGKTEVPTVGKESASAENYVWMFLILLFVVPPLVGVIRNIGSNVGGVEGNLINVIADVLSPEVSIILLAVSVFSYFTVKMLKSRE